VIQFLACLDTFPQYVAIVRQVGRKGREKGKNQQTQLVETSKGNNSAKLESKCENRVLNAFNVRPFRRQNTFDSLAFIKFGSG